MKRIKCPVSGSSEVRTFLELDSIPVFCNVLYPTRESALNAPRAPLSLSYCASSGHVFNSAFEADLVAYSGAYENALHFSATFQEYAVDLADRLIDEYGIRGSKVIDIGCGDGHFLNLICERGSNEGLGFDPSFTPDEDESAAARASGVHIRPESFSASSGLYEADLITCRHVLEHIESPRQFVREIMQMIAPSSDPVFYFEVPDVRYTLERMAIWDLIYEHCSFYSKESLRILFESAGLEVLSVRESFGGQFLSLEARIRKDRGQRRAEGRREAEEHNSGADYKWEKRKGGLQATTVSFAKRFHGKVDKWRDVLCRGESDISASKRTVIWGAGSKGVTILNILNVLNEVEYIVDINPRKQGKYAPCTGQKIVSPEFMVTYKPDVVVVMNEIYADEIVQTLKRLGLSSKILLA